MGERASIKVTHSEGGHIWLYTHWRGYEIVDIAAEGLERAKAYGRLTDAPYATRIIFDVMTELNGETTGYGIHIGGETPDSNYECPEIAWHTWGDVPTVTYNGKVYSVEEFLTFASLGRSISV